MNDRDKKIIYFGLLFIVAVLFSLLYISSNRVKAANEATFLTCDLYNNQTEFTNSLIGYLNAAEDSSVPYLTRLDCGLIGVG